MPSSSEHTIQLSHDDCEHESDDFFCLPSIVEIICTAPTDVPGCRFACTECSDVEGWLECLSQGPAEPPTHPADGMHCENGHRLEVVECTVSAWLIDTNAESSYDGDPDADPWRDGPVDIEWNGNGYAWKYASV